MSAPTTIGGYLASGEGSVMVFGRGDGAGHGVRRGRDRTCRHEPWGGNGADAPVP